MTKDDTVDTTTRRSLFGSFISESIVLFFLANLSFYFTSKTTMTHPTPTFSLSITTLHRRVIFWLVYFIVSFLLLISHFFKSFYN